MEEARATLLDELAQGAPVALLATTPDGTIVYANEAAHSLLGYSGDARLEGLNLYDRVAPEDLDVRPLDPRRIADGAKPSNERLMIKSDESRVWVKTLTQRSADGRLLFWLEDLSERHQLIEEVREAQRVETVGLVAAGLAHDFNNLLAIVVGHADLLRTHHEDERSQRALGAILDAGERASQLTRKLLAFGQKQRLEPALTSLNTLVRQNLAFLSSLLGEHIAMVVDLAEDLHVVEVDVAQIEQVLLNLVTNACQVMEHGGRLRICTRNAQLDATSLDALVRPRADPHFALLSIEDTGPGMPQHVLKRAFDPFFTTREFGTGLGLSVVHGVVAQSGGLVRVRSEVGVGSTFEVLLPKAYQASKTAPPPSRNDEGTAHAVLLSEHDETARVWLAQALERRGYRVQTANDGSAALNLVLAHGQAPLAVVADMSAPGLPAFELVMQLRSLWPNVPAVVLIEQPLQTAGQPPGSSVLTKPVAATALVACLENLLATKPR